MPVYAVTQTAPERQVPVFGDGQRVDIAAAAPVEMSRACVMHRMGAVVVTVYFAWLVYKLTRNRELMPLGLSLLALLMVQIALGIINVTYSLPLAVATMHNGVAALLLINMVVLLYKTRKP